MPVAVRWACVEIVVQRVGVASDVVKWIASDATTALAQPVWSRWGCNCPPPPGLPSTTSANRANPIRCLEWGRAGEAGCLTQLIEHWNRFFVVLSNHRRHYWSVSTLVSLISGLQPAQRWNSVTWCCLPGWSVTATELSALARHAWSA